MTFPENVVLWEAFLLSSSDDGSLPSIETALNLMQIAAPSQRLRFARTIKKLNAIRREWIETHKKD